MNATQTLNRTLRVLGEGAPMDEVVLTRDEAEQIAASLAAGTINQPMAALLTKQLAALET